MIACSKQDYDELWFTRQAIGTTLDPHSAFLLARGLKTFDLRSRTMSANAQAVAKFLTGHPKISRLSYPGLASHPGHAVAARQMRGGFGGMMAFDVGEEQEDAKRFIRNLRLIYHAVSLATESSSYPPDVCFFARVADGFRRQGEHQMPVVGEQPVEILEDPRAGPVRPVRLPEWNRMRP